VDLEDQLGGIRGGPALARAGAALPGLDLEAVPAVGKALDAQPVLLAEEFRQIHGAMMPMGSLRRVGTRRR
jgi:hypothetical protein